jgi:hypothetical protein
MSNSPHIATQSFITYLRSIFLQSNKDVFDVHALPHEEYAEALGLPGAPNIKFKVFIPARSLLLFSNTIFTNLSFQICRNKEETKINRVK